MRALVMEDFGSAAAAKVMDYAKPSYGPADVLVRVAAASVNPVDWKQIAGFLKSVFPPDGRMWVAGSDGAGVVEAVGAQVTDFKPGDAVVFRSPPMQGTGTFAEYCRVPAAVLGKAPKSIDLNAAASIPVAGMTAYQGLFAADMGNLKAGQSVLIHGASGGVGSFAVGLAHASGAKVAGTCRTENVSYVAGLGAMAIDYKKDNVVAAAKKWMPKGVDLAVDTFSGGAAKELLDTLAPGGRLVVVATGTADVDIPAMTAEAKARGLSYHFVMMDVTQAPKFFAGIAALIDSGKMKMPEITAVPLDKAADAVLAVQKGGTRGKIVIKIADVKK